MSEESSLEKKSEQYKTRKVLYRDESIKLRISSVRVTNPNIYFKLDLPNDENVYIRYSKYGNGLEGLSVLKDLLNNKKITIENLKETELELDFKPDNDTVKILNTKWPINTHFQTEPPNVNRNAYDYGLSDHIEGKAKRAYWYKTASDGNGVEANIKDIKTRNNHLLLIVDTGGVDTRFRMEIPEKPDPSNNPVDKFIRDSGGELESLEGESVIVYKKDDEESIDSIAKKEMNENWILTTKRLLQKKNKRQNTNKPENNPSKFNINIFTFLTVTGSIALIVGLVLKQYLIGVLTILTFMWIMWTLFQYT